MLERKDKDLFDVEGFVQTNNSFTQAFRGTIYITLFTVGVSLRTSQDLRSPGF